MHPRHAAISSISIFLSSMLLPGGPAQAQNTPDAEAQVSGLIKQLTLEEKVSLIHANSAFTTGSVIRLGIPELTMSDGPHGVRPEQGRYWVKPDQAADSGTYLPTGICLAATWNPDLGYAFGSVLGSEANYRGKDVILGPGINIIRTPLNGRNFEYESEDPYLISRMVVAYIRGVQDQGVSACVKHFAANNQETARGWIDVLISERALREIYLPGFKAAVTEAHVNTLMGAYNKLRGQWCTHNDYLMNKVLKGEWHFDGVVISDWGSVHSTMEALTNGTDLEMGTDLSMLPHPNYHKFFLGDTVLDLVRSGQVPESVIDEKVRRILRLMIRTHMLDHQRPKGQYNSKEHQHTALHVAEEGIVLLKNQNKFLPLREASIKKLAVIGFNAARPQAMGGGSSQVKAFFEITPLQGLQDLLGNKIEIHYEPGYLIRRGGKADSESIRKAAEWASKADAVILVGGWTHGYNYQVWGDNAYDAESVDKKDLILPFGQDELIKSVLKANPRTVVVLMGGGPAELSAWIDQAPAVVQAWYPGMEGGEALAKMLFGRVNPSGKLPISWPKHLDDCGSQKLGEYPGNGKTEHYLDDIYVGYRYYDTYQVEPQFPFGFGLSYTDFAYSNLKLTANGHRATVTFNIQNTGKMAGAETAQIYVHQEKSSLPRPEKELKGFAKIWLEPGEKKQVTVQLDETSFQYFDDKEGRWVLEPGFFDILVGSSSRSIRLKDQLQL
jgi:beta-glucosidase